MQYAVMFTAVNVTVDFLPYFRSNHSVYSVELAYLRQFLRVLAINDMTHTRVLAINDMPVLQNKSGV